jgi:integrase
MIRTDTWRKSADALDAFYRWAQRRQLLSRRHNPIRGIRRPLAVSTNGAVDGAEMRKYDKLLHCPRASHRDRAIVWLLAHGLTPHEVSRLRPADVDLERREVRVRIPGRACRSRLVPLSEKAAAVLEPWVLPRLKFGHTWLFQGARRGQPPSSHLVRQVVHRLAAEVFGPQWQDRIGQGIHPCGFRDVFITRAIQSRMPADCLVELLGLDRISRLRRYTQHTVTSERLHAEVRRLTSRSRGWI